MNQNPSIKFTATILPFLVGIALMLSCNAFAKDQVTQAELDAAIAAQSTVDAGQNATIGNQTAAIKVLQNQIADLTKIYTVGEVLSDGGIVFWVDEMRRHGLAAWPFDEDFILANWYRAKEAAESHGVGWRLPTKHELDLLSQNRDVVGGYFSGGADYWSSTEKDQDNVWIQFLSSGTNAGFQSFHHKEGSFAARAIRAF